MKLLVLFFIITIFLYSNNCIIAQEELKDVVKKYAKEADLMQLAIAYSDGKETQYLNYKDDKVFQYQIGSISKLFVGHALVQLILENEDLTFNDKVGEHLNFISYEDERIKNITLMQLANHSSGLPRLPLNLMVTVKDPLQPYENYKIGNLYNTLSSYNLTREPGSSYEYSNFGFALLGHILDKYLINKKKSNLEEYIEKEIFTKAGMQNTSLEPTKTIDIIGGYQDTLEVPHWKFEVMKWAGAYYSTSEDLVKYISALNSSTYPQEVVDILYDKSMHLNESMKVSVAWHINDFNDELLYWHNGSTYANAGFIGFIKGTKKFVVDRKSVV